MPASSSIDPIRTVTADAAARQFIQPLPGTDIAMMLAMMHVIIRDGLDERHVGGRAHHRATTSCATRSPTGLPSRAAAVTGLDADVIERLARDYATIRPAAIRTLIGAEHHENGAMFFRTLACFRRSSEPGPTWWRHRQERRLLPRRARRRFALCSGPTCSPADAQPRRLNMSRLGEMLTEPRR